uniref:Uncharacterized protein n=2 Tax=Panagrolaimus sp. JU765 TaxID=591449 RepID=A0AC34RNB9_9BILA
MEACQQGILQLDSLRQKHHKLMEQLRSQYPDFAPLINRPLEISNYDSTTLPSSSGRCESPMSSACVSHRSSVSIDSGYTSISSDPILGSSPMSYSAYRKKASTLDRVPHSSTMPSKPDVSNNENDPSVEIVEKTIESTAGLRLNRLRPNKNGEWQRPRSMYATLPGLADEDVVKSPKDEDREALAGVSVAATAKKLLDASTFSQITPPPLSRKFATFEKPTPPKPHPRSSQTLSALPSRALNSSSSTVHQNPPPTPVLKTVPRPPPQFAKFEAPIHLQNAKVYAPVQPRTLPPSPNSAFSPSLKKQSTPPMKPRSTSAGIIQPQRAFIVPILASSKEVFPRRIALPHDPPNFHLTRPTTALTRQTSSDSTNLSTASPMEARKLFLATPHTISRYGSVESRNEKASPNRNRREKYWQESEGL